MGGEPMAGSPPFFYAHERVLAGGERGIRTLDTGFGPYAPLAGECLRPLGHLSGQALDFTTSRSQSRWLASNANSCRWRWLVELERAMQHAHRELEILLV